MDAEHQPSMLAHAQFIAKSVNEASGVLRGVTVAQAGVVAKGHFIMLDKNNQITGDPKLAVRRLQMATDAKTLQTLLQAAKDVGGQVRTREDHNDSIEARVGTLENFQLEGDKVIGDLTVLNAYGNRDLLFEIAKTTPDLIGLSIDFGFDIDIINNMAFVRVKSLHAVDVVDEGAVTPRGLFHSKRNEQDQRQLKPKNNMADDPSPTGVEDAMSAIKALAARCDAMESAHKKHADAMAAIAKKFAPAAKPVPDEDGKGDPGNDESTSDGLDDDDGGKGNSNEKHPTNGGTDQGSAKDGISADPHKPTDEYKALKAELKTMQKQMLQFRSERQALGLKDTPITGKDKESTADANGKDDNTQVKSFRALVLDYKTENKCSFAVASEAVSKAHPEVLKAQMASHGILRTPRKVA